MRGYFSPASLRLADLAALVAVAVWAVALTFGLPPARLPTDPLQMVDFGLNTRQAEIVAGMVADAVASGRPIVYPDHYAYPPAFVVLMLVWMKLGAWAYPAWMGLMIAALFMATAAGGRVAGLGTGPGRFAAAALAVLATAYAMGWDLKTRNINLVYLAAVMLALAAADRRPAMAGMLLSLSSALKLYSVLFLPWLLWRRQWAWLGWTVAGMVLWFAALPVLWFGWPGAWGLTLAWIDALAIMGTPAYQAVFPGYLVTLHRAVAWALQTAADDRLAIASTLALQVAWLAFVACKLWPRALPLANEAALVMLLPLPLAPLLQPHHTVVFLLPALVLLAEAARGHWRSAAVLAAAAVLTQAGPGGGWRAVATMLATLALAAAVAQRGQRL